MGVFTLARINVSAIVSLRGMPAESTYGLSLSLIHIFPARHSLRRADPFRRGLNGIKDILLPGAVTPHYCCLLYTSPVP